MRWNEVKRHQSACSLYTTVLPEYCATVLRTWRPQCCDVITLHSNGIRGSRTFVYSSRCDVGCCLVLGGRDRKNYTIGWLLLCLPIISQYSKILLPFWDLWYHTVIPFFNSVYISILDELAYPYSTSMMLMHHTLISTLRSLPKSWTKMQFVAVASNQEKHATRLSKEDHHRLTPPANNC